MTAVAKLKKPVVVYREAVDDDMMDVYPLCEALYEDSGMNKYVAFNREDMLKTLHLLAHDKNGVLFISEVNGEIVGMAAATIQPWYWNYKVDYCRGLFFYVKPEYRGNGYGKKFLRMIEDRARRLECTTLVKIDSFTINNNRFL